ncbi:hypothetical protein Csa_014420 [Cucumis sativus]|uniref:Uncharacterized protein n=1 Tax=Cucumis sativus TaxID=3659 RepID=A0A0A0KXC1_CUCSA|nr:hypothetical protein Csa_014420 [Cucumis sativus]
MSFETKFKIQVVMMLLQMIQKFHITPMRQIKYKDQTDACYRSDEGSMDFYTLLRDKGGGRRGTLENTRERRLKSWVDLNHDDD